MSVRIFALRGVPGDEADGVRQCLVDAGVEFYETPPGSAGFAADPADPAIWVADDVTAARARAAIDRFEQEWCRRADEEIRRTGLPDGGWPYFAIKVIAVIAVCWLAWEIAQVARHR